MSSVASAAVAAAPMIAPIFCAKNLAVAGEISRPRISSFGNGKPLCPCCRQITLVRRRAHCKTSTSSRRRRVLWIASAGAQSSNGSSSGSSSSSSAQSPTTSVDAGGEEQAERARKSLKDLSETLALPSGFLSNLPNDLRVDLGPRFPLGYSFNPQAPEHCLQCMDSDCHVLLNDAAFALSSGPVNQECGEKVGRLLMALSRAWEQADTQAVEAIAKEAPFLQDYLPSDPSSNAGNYDVDTEKPSLLVLCKPALGKRLQSAGKYLRSTGDYGKGELKKMAMALVAAGEALSLGKPSPEGKGLPQDNTRVFKFGDLQVQLTAQNAYIGAAIAFGFGTLSWLLTSSFNSIPISTFASSLRGTVLTAGYSCTALSAMTMVGLLGLASQLGSSDNKSP